MKLYSIYKFIIYPFQKSGNICSILFTEINLKLEPWVVLNCDAQEQAKREVGISNWGWGRSKGKEENGERGNCQMKED